MARLDIVAIRKAIASTAGTVVKNSTAYRPDDVNTFPWCWVDMPPIEKLTFQANAVWELEIRLVLAVANNWDRASQETVDRLTVDLWEAFDDDKTLSGTVSSAVLTRFNPVSTTELRDWVGGTFDMKVGLSASLASP